jgi:hypothetical protein
LSVTRAQEAAGLSTMSLIASGKSYRNRCENQLPKFRHNDASGINHNNCRYRAPSDG